MTMSNIKNQEF